MKFLLMTTYDGATVLQVFIMITFLLVIIYMLCMTIVEICETCIKNNKEEDKNADNGKDM